MIRSRKARTRAAAHAHGDGDGERELGRSWSVSGARADGPAEQTLRLRKKVALQSTTVEYRAALELDVMGECDRWPRDPRGDR
jgi:hypothetical protein